MKLKILAIVAVMAMSVIGPANAGKLFCIPKEVKTKQLRQIFIKFANEHPETIHLGAGGMELNAFAEAFPCE
jgi:hypothetical protein